MLSQLIFNRSALSFICAADSSPLMYKTLESFPYLETIPCAVCNKSVDFPIPGSPPSKIAERFVFVQDEKEITQNIKLFSCNSYKKSVATNAFGLMQLQNGTFVPDNFNHEHYLLIQEGDKKILISGCSHKGILNIVEWFKPDFLIGGFHFK